MGRQKVYANKAEKQRAYRARRKAQELQKMQLIASAVQTRGGVHDSVLQGGVQTQSGVQEREDAERLALDFTAGDPPITRSTRPGLISLEEHAERVRGLEYEPTLSIYSR